MIYSVIVKPGSRKGPLVVATAPPPAPTAPSLPTPAKQCAPELTIYLREKPVDGAANTALIKLLAAHFRVAKSCVIIKSGVSSRHKLIEILGQ